MLGTFRFALALLVVLTHLGNWRWPGVYAVFGFYVISGYLMCLVLNRRYGFGTAGLRAYCTNRFLRIYPPYWFACFVSAALIGALGRPLAAELYGPWQVPATLMDWIDNFGIATLPTGNVNRLVPPSWALRVEIFYYALIGLGMGRGRRLAIAWVAASVGYHLYLGRTGVGWEARYYPIAAASLPFSLGALLYHVRELLPARWLGFGTCLGPALALWTANLLLAPLSLGTTLGPLRFYLNLACVTAIVASLSRWETASDALRSHDARLGDLSYPIYLMHMQTGLVVSALGLVSATPSFTRFGTCLLPVLLASWVTLRLVSDPIEELRRGVRRRFGAGLAPAEG